MKLSIITVNLNNLQGLKETMQSVFSQTFTDYEYIIIDGSSTDGSKELIEQHADKLSYWVSEPDNGIYNAMNKGILNAKGEYLMFLNSGDWLCQSETIVNFVKDIDGYDIIYGDQYLSYLNGEVIEDKLPDILTFDFLAYRGSLPHQACLIKRAILVKYGLYNEKLKMVSDWKFYLEAVFKWQCKYLHKHLFVVFFNKEGFSSNPNFYALKAEEQMFVLKQEFPNFLKFKDEVEYSRKVFFYYTSSRFVKLLRKIKVLREV